MRLSYSTRGWQRLSWDEQIEAALDADFEGIEVYDLFKRTDLVKRGGPFDKYNAVTTARQLREKGLRIPCLDASCDISGKDCIDRMAELIEVARAMQIPYVSAPAYLDDDDAVRANLSELLPIAEHRHLLRYRAAPRHHGRFRQRQPGGALGDPPPVP